MKAGDLLGQANCIQGLGEVAEQSGDLDQARTNHRSALEIYSRIAALDSMGSANVRLARTAPDDGSRRRYVRAAREVWTLAKRDDLLQDLRAEFPDIE